MQKLQESYKLGLDKSQYLATVNESAFNLWSCMHSIQETVFSSDYSRPPRLEDWLFNHFQEVGNVCELSLKNTVQKISIRCYQWIEWKNNLDIRASPNAFAWTFSTHSSNYLDECRPSCFQNGKGKVQKNRTVNSGVSKLRFLDSQS